TPPEISINLKVVPGQDNSPQFVAGTIPVGTDIEVPIEIIDQEMGAAILTVTYNASVYAVQLSQTGYSIYQPVTADNPAAMGKNIYQPSFSAPIAGSQTRYFRPGMPGTYTFILSATDAAGNSERQSVTVRAVSSGEIPGPIDGQPVVDKILPEDKAADIMVSMPIVVAFSEPINGATLNANSFRLIDLATGAQVAADIYISINGGMMTATLQPRTNLAYGHEYEIVLTRDIKDSNPNPSQNGEFLPLDQEYRYRFTTKTPDIYDLTAGGFELTPGGRGGANIALYTDRESGRAYSYVTAEEAGWRAVDVTDPTMPFVTYKENHSQPPDTATPNVAWRYRGAAVDQETGILVLTEWIYWNCAECGNFGYVSFYDVGR
ncbi:MAG TPA: Ig-like domain-containing protein, partial [Syntrophales bacterium]|nr:Ig-like domain-containing protein [Syntrophales bacterium]